MGSRFKLRAVIIAVAVGLWANAAAAQDRLPGVLRELGPTILNEVLKSQEGQERSRSRQVPTSAPVEADEEAARIKALQQALTAAGYKLGTPDGIWGNAARRAARSFQTDAGFQATGRLTAEQVQKLVGETRSKLPAATVRVLEAAPEASSGFLAYDETEEKIVEVQRALSEAGFPAGDADGVWGASAKRAAKAFQVSRGYPATGRMSVAEIDELQRAASSGGRSTAGPVQLAQASAEPKPAVLPGTVPTQLRSLSLQSRDGAILVGSSTISTYEALQPGLLRLQRLLVLSVRPELLSEKQSSKHFLTLIGRDADMYEAPTYKGAPRQYWEWKGRDEFEREDNRKLFVTREGDRIRAMIPALPFDILELRPARLGDYDVAKGQFSIDVDRHATWATGFGFRMPTNNPQAWPLKETDARAVLERLRVLYPPKGTAEDHFLASRRRDMTFAVRYRITAIRNVDGSIIADAQPLSAAFYARDGLDLSKKIADAVLPELAPKTEASLKQSDDKSKNLAEPEDTSIDPANAPLAVLGITLGQTSEEAEKALREHFSGRQFDETVAVSQDGLYKANKWFNEVTSQFLKEQIVLLYEKDGEADKVTAVGRLLPMGDVTGTAAVNTLKDRLGTPDYTAGNCGDRCELLWGATKAAKRRFAKNGYDGCAAYAPRAFNGQFFNLHEVTKACGAFLSVYVESKHKMTFVLGNSDKILDERRLVAQERARAREIELKKKTDKLKF